MTKCEFVEMPVRHTVSVRTRTPVQNLPMVLGGAYHAAMEYLGEVSETPDGAPFVAYYNMDMQDLDIAAGFVVKNQLPARGNLRSDAIPAGTYAQCVHVGPYDQCGPAHEALTQFVLENGRKPTGVAYEFYLNEPQTTPPAELQTLIVFAVE